MTSPAFNSYDDSASCRASDPKSTQVVDLTLLSPFFPPSNSSSNSCQPRAAFPHSIRRDNLLRQVPDLTLFNAFYRLLTSGRISSKSTQVPAITLNNAKHSTSPDQKTPAIPPIPANSTCLHFTRRLRKSLISLFFTSTIQRNHAPERLSGANSPQRSIRVHSCSFVVSPFLRRFP